MSLMTGCGIMPTDDAGSGGYSTDSSGGSASVGGAGSTSGGGLATGTGGASGGPSRFDYSALCGSGDCSPEKSDECAGGGSTGGAGGAPSGALGCQLAETNGTIAPACLPIGSKYDGEPCTSSLDCAEGFGCVFTNEITSASVCRAYCCGDVEACAANTYCAPKRLAPSIDLQIPVCVPAEECTLLMETSCPEGEACTLVRDDGVTSCLPPGDGLQCGECPCAAGYRCNTATNQCFKLCHTEGADECPQNSLCQGGSGNYPDGIGVCAGGDAECGD